MTDGALSWAYASHRQKMGSNFALFALLEGEFEKDRGHAAGADQSAEAKRSDHAELLSVCGLRSASVFIRVHPWFN